jgi:hypothetical protein
MAHVSGADSWSKDRIRQEIRSREREIENIRENIDEREGYHESTGYRNADPGWSNRLYEEMGDLKGEIDFLTSLL